MLFKYIFLICCLSIFLFTACEKEVTTIKPKDIEPKLVVTCFISPDDTLLRATLSKSFPVLDTGELSSNIILDGVMHLSDGTTSVELLFNPREQFYTADASRMPIVAGKTYYLQASEPGGLKVSASCTIPAAPTASLHVQVDSTATIMGDGSDGYEYFIKMQWQDMPGARNYYRVAADLKTKEVYSGQYYNNSYAVAWPYEGRNQFMNDNVLDGAMFTSPNGYLTGLYQRTPIAQVYAYLLHTDKHYYLYHQSARDSRIENPFAEPVVIYSNIEGGLGVFAGYIKETAVAKVR